MLLIPLSKSQSRGDQILNAQFFESSGFCSVLHEEALTPETLVRGVLQLYANRGEFIANMQKYERADALSKLVDVIEKKA